MQKLSLIATLLATGTACVAKEGPVCAESVFSTVETSVVQISNPEVTKGGSAVFVTSTILATAEHVLDGVATEAGDDVLVRYGKTVGEKSTEEYHLKVESVDYVDTGLPDRIALLHLNAGLVDREKVTGFSTSLEEGQPVVGVYYEINKLMHVAGRYRPQTASDESENSGGEQAPFLLFELVGHGTVAGKEPRKGSSGGAVFDCDGKVVSFIHGFVEYPRKEFSSPFLKPGFRPPSLDRGFRWWANKPNTLGLPVSFGLFEMLD